MIDTIIEESCVYCSKCLAGLNDFNRKMHINTCKVRKLVDANHANSPDSQLDSFIVVGENCSYCFKSFKDFKSDFNKRLHIKCCKIKKETYDEKNNAKMSMGGEHCVFCTKPLANLNEFNKRMHIENCKIRKSIENSGSPVYSSPKKAVKDHNLVKMGMELGENCLYCSKSFVNLSDFNKKLHFEYCKLKKKKLAHLSAGLSMHLGQCSTDSGLGSSPQQSQSMNNSNQLGHSFNSSPIGTNPTNNATNLNSSIGHLNSQLMNISSLNNSVVQQHHDQQQQQQLHQQSCSEDSKIGKLDLGESCLFCSRSLVNLSNFNKRIHIETCKIKTLKKATSKLRQTASTGKSPRKRPTKKEKIDSPNTSINNLYSCQSLNKTLTLELMGSNLGNLVSLNVDHNHQITGMSQVNPNQNIIQMSALQQNQQQQQQMQHQVQQQQQQQQQQANLNGMSQFDSLVASLNGHTSSLNLTQMQQHMNNQQQQAKLESGQYRQQSNNNGSNNADGIYI